MKVKKKNKWKIATVVLGILLLISFIANGIPYSDYFVKESRAEDAVSFVNDNLLGGAVESKLVGVEEESGLYLIEIELQGRSTQLYMSKDGKLLFPSAIDLSQDVDIPKDNQNKKENIPKTDKPTVELYVMSFCPYGNKAEDTLEPVYNLLKEKVEWKIHYIVSVDGNTVNSLHGQPEADQNMREVCVMEYNGLDAWWDFATYVNDNCGSDGSCWEDASGEAGFDVNEINACVESAGVQFMEEEEKATNKAQATGSPTMLINGVKTRAVYDYGNSESYKEAICSAFNEAPQECEEMLNSESSGVSGSC